MALSLDSLEGRLKTKIGPLPAWAWGTIAVVVFYLYYERKKAANAANQPSENPAAVTSGPNGLTSVPASQLQDDAGLQEQLDSLGGQLSTLATNVGAQTTATAGNTAALGDNTTAVSGNTVAVSGNTNAVNRKPPITDPIVGPIQVPRSVHVTVQPGQTVADIARLTGVSQRAILAANKHLKNPNHPGDVLTIPVTQAPASRNPNSVNPRNTTVKVPKGGVNLTTLAHDYGTSVHTLRKLNPNLKNPGHAGDVVVVPNKTAVKR